MGLLDWIGSIFKPAAELIDEIHVSDEERMEMRNRLEAIRAGTQAKTLEYHSKIADLQAKLAEEAGKVAVAESKSDSAFTRLYRPLILTGMFVLICLNSFGILTNPVPDIFMSVFGAAFGVVGIGRTAEKITRFKQ